MMINAWLKVKNTKRKLKKGYMSKHLKGSYASLQITGYLHSIFTDYYKH